MPAKFEFANSPRAREEIRAINWTLTRQVPPWHQAYGVAVTNVRIKGGFPFCASLSRPRSMVHRPMQVVIVWRKGRPVRMGARYVCGYICSNVELISSARGHILCGTCDSGRAANIHVH